MKIWHLSTLSKLHGIVICGYKWPFSTNMLSAAINISTPIGVVRSDIYKISLKLWLWVVFYKCHHIFQECNGNDILWIFNPLFQPKISQFCQYIGHPGFFSWLRHGINLLREILWMAFFLHRLSRFWKAH